MRHFILSVLRVEDVGQKLTFRHILMFLMISFLVAFVIGYVVLTICTMIHISKLEGHSALEVLDVGRFEYFKYMTEYAKEYLLAHRILTLCTLVPMIICTGAFCFTIPKTKDHFNEENENN